MAQITYEAAIERLCQSTGNTWIPEKDLRSFMDKYNAGPLSNLNPAIKNGDIIVARKEEINLFSCKTIHRAEIQVVKNIFRIAKAPIPRYSDQYLDQLIKAVEKRKKVSLHENQKNAVKMAINNSFLILTGGPGTGKTFVLNFINEIHKILNHEIVIAYTAPTGKAARRITESTGFKASTIHSCINITAENMKPTPLSKQIHVLTVDEVSMLDIYVFNALMEAIQTGTKLILVGDTDQLPSVGPGAVLRDLILSGVLPVAKLTATFRQAGDSTLFDNIQRIKNGNSHLVAGNDFAIAVPKVGMSAKEILLWMYKKEVKEYGIDNVMCLTPFRKEGNTCSDVMNFEIQKVVNPSGPCIRKQDGIIFRQGDLVMQLENRSLCANGDVGKVTRIFKNGIRVQFLDSEMDYSLNTLSDISLAYAMSIHKSQGSEAKSVITPLLSEHTIMLQRNLLYTAVTRAKAKCSLLCDPKAVDTAIKNEVSHKRITLLSELLQYGASQLKEE